MSDRTYKTFRMYLRCNIYRCNIMYWNSRFDLIHATRTVRLTVINVVDIAGDTSQQFRIPCEIIVNKGH